MLCSHRHRKRIVERGFRNECQFENQVSGIMDYLKQNHWYNTIDEWMEKSRIWDQVTFLPRRYINSRVPAHIMLERHFSHITFAAEVTYD